jgi:hypothetical protein
MALLPQWIQWTALVPLTDAFRLLIAEEFSICLECTHYEQFKLHCTESCMTTLGKVAADTNNLEFLYNEMSVLRLDQEGMYVSPVSFFAAGQDLVASFWSTCPAGRYRVMPVIDRFPAMLTHSTHWCS